MLQSLQLTLALPEIVLATGAMALLMLGVATRKDYGELILWLAIAILIAGVVVLAFAQTLDVT